MGTLLIIGIIVFAIAYYVISVYNKIIRYIEAVRNNQKQIDIQLDRRFKVFESLIDVVKKYMDYEKSTFKEIVALRNQAQAAKASGDDAGRIAAESKISNMMPSINLVFEQYPDLKANQNALQLQEEIVNTENKLTFAKQAYNDSIERYNATIKQFVESIIVSMFESKLMQHFEYWGISDESRQRNEDYTVKM